MKWKLLKGISLFLSFLSCGCINSNTLNFETKKVEWPYSVIDGDTIKINKNLKVRLFGIDTPETSKLFVKNDLSKLENFYASKAKSFIRSITYQKPISLKKISNDKYNRWVCIVWCDNKDLSELLILNGLARVNYVSLNKFSPYWINDSKLKGYINKLKSIEQSIRRKNIGIWKYSNTLIFHKN
ncbi:thermonuclease family protein [Mycoplasmopsis lipofaciens]|uniref:thermonuclease family protein n=1 Tax=Mycoplasmopsis lipofaciens TaxID=114884 RepID=UPI000482A83D|nr:thermonuclease family protein [Mycoplasmopsis lipofaciens]